MYQNESEIRYSIGTLERELRSRKERIPEAIQEPIEDIMASARELAVGETLDVLSLVKDGRGQSKVYLTITKNRIDVFAIFTYYIGLNNQLRGPCMGIPCDIPFGAKFMTLGGNSEPPGIPPRRGSLNPFVTRP